LVQLAKGAVICSIAAARRFSAEASPAVFVSAKVSTMAMSGRDRRMVVGKRGHDPGWELAECCVILTLRDV
jgi:hypothetical protein